MTHNLTIPGTLPGGWKHISGFSDDFEVDKLNPLARPERRIQCV